MADQLSGIGISSQSIVLCASAHGFCYQRIIAVEVNRGCTTDFPCEYRLASH
jgi:hypothetical protein